MGARWAELKASGWGFNEKRGVASGGKKGAGPLSFRRWRIVGGV